MFQSSVMFMLHKMTESVKWQVSWFEINSLHYNILQFVCSNTVNHAINWVQVVSQNPHMTSCHILEYVWCMFQEITTFKIIKAISHNIKNCSSGTNFKSNITLYLHEQ